MKRKLGSSVGLWPRKNRNTSRNLGVTVLKAAGGSTKAVHGSCSRAILRLYMLFKRESRLFRVAYRFMGFSSRALLQEF